MSKFLSGYGRWQSLAYSLIFTSFHTNRHITTYYACVMCMYIHLCCTHAQNIAPFTTLEGVHSYSPQLIPTCTIDPNYITICNAGKVRWGEHRSNTMHTCYFSSMSILNNAPSSSFPGDHWKESSVSLYSLETKLCAVALYKCPK